jgi:hypothetical protein
VAVEREGRFRPEFPSAAHTELRTAFLPSSYTSFFSTVRVDELAEAEKVDRNGSEPSTVTSNDNG